MAAACRWCHTKSSHLCRIVLSQTCLSSPKVFCGIGKYMKPSELSCCGLLTYVFLRVFLFHTPVSQQRGSKDAEFCRCCRLSPFGVVNAVKGQIYYGFVKKPKTAPDFNTSSKAVDLPQTLQWCYLVNLHPQPPVCPAWPVSSSVSRLDAPWFAVRGRPPFTGMSGHRGPLSPVIGIDPSVLVPWLAAQNTSLQ